MKEQVICEKRSLGQKKKTGLSKFLNFWENGRWNTLVHKLVPGNFYNKAYISKKNLLNKNWLVVHTNSFYISANIWVSENKIVFTPLPAITLVLF